MLPDVLAQLAQCGGELGPYCDILPITSLCWRFSSTLHLISGCLVQSLIFTKYQELLPNKQKTCVNHTYWKQEEWLCGEGTGLGSGINPNNPQVLGSFSPLPQTTWRPWANYSLSGCEKVRNVPTDLQGAWLVVLVVTVCPTCCDLHGFYGDGHFCISAQLNNWPYTDVCIAEITMLF